MIYKIRDIKNEILWFLRNNDFISTSGRGVQTKTFEKTLDSDISVTIPDSDVKNIRQIKIGETVLTFNEEYTYSTENNAVVTFKQAKSGEMKITYDTGSKDKIYPDYPRDDLTLSNYPRIGFDIIAINSNPLSIGGTDFISDVLLDLVVYAQKQREVEEILDSIREKLIENSKDFAFDYVQVNNLGRTVGEGNTLVHRNLTFTIKFLQEDK